MGLEHVKYFWRTSAHVAEREKTRAWLPFPAVPLTEDQVVACIAADCR